MIKTFGMLHKRGDITQEQFHAHWRGPHADHAVKLVPVMRRYVQNHRAATAYPGFQPPSDGCPEVWLEDLAAARRLTTMPEYMTGAFIDEPAFMRVRSEGVLVYEKVMIEGPKLARDARPVKALFFLKRNPGVSRAAFEEFWLERETPVFTGGEHLQRWVKSRPVGEAYVGAEPMYDGVEELWWADKAAHEKDAAAYADRTVDNFIDRSATRAMFVDENRVVWEG
ncbi:MAG: EthD domain-containing protein [Sphingomonadales bacterium]